MPNKPHLHIGHLFPQTMSTYGDTGNIRCLVQRCVWRGIEVTVHPFEIGDPLIGDIDLYFFGGGQDAAQTQISQDLQKKKADRILTDVKTGTPLLAVCGGYQLLGEAYFPFDADPVPGINLFPVETHASNLRMIGNLIIKSELLEGKTIVGFENHSGKTLLKGGQSLGTVVTGFGNNGVDHQEGCIIENALGCYLHGPVLPKNPHLADWLIQKALLKKGYSPVLLPLNDELEWAAHHSLVARFTK